MPLTEQPKKIDWTTAKLTNTRRGPGIPVKWKNKHPNIHALRYFVDKSGNRGVTVEIKVQENEDS